MTVIRFIIFTAFIIIISTNFGCQKDPDTIIKTVTDTIYIQKTDTLTITKLLQDTLTTFILSRHAETSGTGTDPSLSAAGQLRATELARDLKNTKISAVYATNYKRTKETAAKIASDNAVPTEIYDPAQLDALVNKILQQYKNGVVYIAGHSNTTNVILNILTGSNTYGVIPDTEYDNLYLVSVSEKGKAKVIHLKYGD
jgi:broad specificity phosphatase PhoE